MLLHKVPISFQRQPLLGNDVAHSAAFGSFRFEVAAAHRTAQSPYLLHTVDAQKILLEILGEGRIPHLFTRIEFRVIQIKPEVPVGKLNIRVLLRGIGTEYRSRYHQKQPAKGQ